RQRKNVDNRFKLGEGLIGQCALEKEKIVLTSVPKDYVAISSGLGEATPLNIIVLPVVFEGQVKAVMELASFSELSTTHQAFLANMSHELRTPLNSLLILSDELSKNKDKNLTDKQVEFSKTIHDSGNDLLSLINDILDLSKIESGTVIVDAGNVPFRELQDYVERTFRHVAEARKLEFTQEFDAELPRAMQTDAKRLQQILKNLLSNAFKFTEKGSVSFKLGTAAGGWSADHPVLRTARPVVCMAVTDTGIGIEREKQQIVFEAFQQA